MWQIEAVVNVTEYNYWVLYWSTVFGSCFFLIVCYFVLRPHYIQKMLYYLHHFMYLIVLDTRHKADYDCAVHAIAMTTL